MNDELTTTKSKKRPYIEISPGLHRQLKIMAAMRGVSLRSLVEAGLVRSYPELSQKDD